MRINKFVTLKTNWVKRADLCGFVARYNQAKRYQRASARRRGMLNAGWAYQYEELVAREKAWTTSGL